MIDILKDVTLVELFDIPELCIKYVYINFLLYIN